MKPRAGDPVRDAIHPEPRVGMLVDLVRLLHATLIRRLLG